MAGLRAAPRFSTCGRMQARDGQEAAPDGRQTRLLSGYVLCVSLFFSFFVTDIYCSALSWRQNVKQKILGGCAFLPSRLLCLDMPCLWMRTATPTPSWRPLLFPYIHASCYLLAEGATDTIFATGVYQ